MSIGISIGDKVLTSKGNFGRVTSIERDKAKVKMGRWEFEIETVNLIPISNTQIINIKYIKDSVTKKTSIVVEKGTILFDINNPDVLENYIKEILGKDIIVQTINL